MAQIAAQICEDKLGRDVVIKELTTLSIICDYFVITSAPTRLQTRDIARSIEEKFEELGLVNKRMQGFREASWILLDYGIVVVHVFLQSERDHYNLEGLWREAPIIEHLSATK
jgi:ribosome-associated protein